MKRLLIPMILLILITGVIFVSCAKDETPATTAETVEETEGKGEDKGTTSTTKEAWVAPTFKTEAATTTVKGGTPVHWATTTTTTKASATTTTTTKSTATTTTTGKHTSKATTVTAETSTKNPVISQDKDYDNGGQIVLPAQPIATADKFGQIDLLELITKVLG